MSPGEDYARLYPGAARWIVRCIACGREGHDPEMPPDARYARALARYLDPLATDEQGYCDECKRVLDQAGSE
jgi:hypothetical protein